MKYIETENVIIKSWCNDPEAGTITQAKNLANLPFVFKQVCLMPDTHQGYGMPIGGVIGTKGVVIPNAVGVDIGCGMCAVKTSLMEIDRDKLKAIMGRIREAIPLGFKHHKTPQKGMPISTTDCKREVVQREFNSATRQLGTLGGGNHFIEIQIGSDGFIWVMIHSGSRNIGLKVATHHNKIAQALNAKWYSSVEKKVELAFIPLNTEEAANYLDEMNYCLAFAKANRALMMKRIKESFNQEIPSCAFDKEIDIHHNYATMENHFNTNVMVHRKGATSAKEGELGIIPGSQGSSSYIVEGLGNPESFKSCSHGAGRKMGRNQAKKTLDLKEEQKKLEDKGIIHSIRSEKELDEASGAYKDIEVVMEEQKDLVKIVVKLEPLAVIKG